MQANSANDMFGVSSDFIQGNPITTHDVSSEALSNPAEPFHFQGQFSSCMEMQANAATVANYLDRHQGWFRRCAEPMTADPLGDNGYALTIGRFSSFNYDVEPKIGLHLLPADSLGHYRIETIAIPGYEPPGYEVEFKAALMLLEDSVQGAAMTRVEWTLDLSVHIQFPRFIHALPQSLIQGTGDRLLNQIVRQASKRLTHKVQDDFHRTIGVAGPRSRRRSIFG